MKPHVLQAHTPDARDGCIRCLDPHPAITVDLPEGDVCATCVQQIVAQLRVENEKPKKRATRSGK